MKYPFTPIETGIVIIIIALLAAICFAPSSKKPKDIKEVKEIINENIGMVKVAEQDGIKVYELRNLHKYVYIIDYRGKKDVEITE